MKEIIIINRPYLLYYRIHRDIREISFNNKKRHKPKFLNYQKSWSRLEEKLCRQNKIDTLQQLWNGFIKQPDYPF